MVMLPVCELGVLQQADGSATCEYGTSSVLCAIYGPCGVRANKELHDKAVLDVTVQCAISRHNNDVAYIKEIITIAVMIRKMDQYHLTCVLTACCMAILDAGLPMTSTFAAVTIDTSTLTDQEACGEVVYVLDCKNKQLLSSRCTATVTDNQFLQGLTMAQDRLPEIDAIYRTTMNKKLSCLHKS